MFDNNDETLRKLVWSIVTNEDDSNALKIDKVIDLFEAQYQSINKTGK